MDAVVGIIIFVVAEPFFFLAYRYTGFKALFALLMIALAVFIVVCTVVDNKLYKKGKRKKDYILLKMKLMMSLFPVILTR